MNGVGDALLFSDRAAEKHMPLLRRAAAVLGNLGSGAAGEAPVALIDASEPAAGAPLAGSTSRTASRTTIRLERRAAPALIRENRVGRVGRDATFTLHYTDSESPATQAALIAATRRPGSPVAADPETLSVLALAERIAQSDIPVLIAGPTGTGKEVLSRFIHEHSPRATGPFIGVNCAAMPETMLEALLFGHQKGAFTGANAAAEGFFRAADGGTLLLDEIAEMPLSLQAKLLRVLQEGEVVPLGATRPIKVDVRVIACVNRDLPLEVDEGRFRADLYYRLNVFPLTLTALCERRADIAPLAFAMLLRHSPEGAAVPWLGDHALALLAAHPWPGNVRELENVIRRALLLAGVAPEIGPEHISFDRPIRPIESPRPLELRQGNSEPTALGLSDASANLSNIVQISETRAILATLERCGGSRVAAARELGISERTLRYRLASFREAGITVGGGRQADIIGGRR
ncbi:sigma 54-interacting transcriptional regulator [Novosphingobium sp.]|uniref:sigma-54 interaction domain-containing protein n=1 Tax=Novosphingobium sp. TaxID=1874826 RepID=UPI0025FC8A9A|nr:sigma 54-interacting transcriptional regulator [Novosphingobium sp.]